MTIPDFERATAGQVYCERGVLFSELFLFVCACEDQGVTTIVESGVHAGVSTRVLRAVFPGRVTSIERNVSTLPSDLRASVVIGDGRDLVPQFIETHPEDRIGVLLDGPKGPRGTAVREWCLQQPNVRVVGQHDSPRGSGESTHSQSPESQAKTAGLDARVPERILAWQRGVHRPGLGIWVQA